MLISLRKRFIFVANLKSASTAIESYLRPYSEVIIAQSRFGKHEALGRIEQRYGWIYDYHKRNEFFIFGVLRDPVSFFASLYNSHRKEDFRGQVSFTGDMTFTEFWQRWPGRNNWQCEPQWERFRNSEGYFDLDYLIDYDKIGDQFRDVCRIVGVPDGQLKMANVSPTDFDASHVPDAIAEEIRRKYAQDLDYLRNSTGHLLRDRPAAA